MAEIPLKSQYRIGEVCQYTDTQPYVLRFWESEFPHLAPEKNRSGQRVYTREDIELILRIKQLLYDEEYTIAGARKRLDQEAGRAASRPRGRRSTSEEEAAAETVAQRFSDRTPRFRATVETVERERYENAVQEVQRLRHELARYEAERDKRAARAESLEQICEQQRQRAERVAASLEALIESISGRRPAHHK